ncbi:hypothetical protein Dfri01_10020 [Dyadobacter frigoris]|uniref:hypothetical protein n=1 Tax=Dyadobacter frigoris TaxID=2576211 RepID=UPI0024A26FCB|nr:hypothetical protein [Dyadobacter frigoris]GLU51541.1 hypothetical protein Dfri01_10020 [Dyadobacter frigoris]
MKITSVIIVGIMISHLQNKQDIAKHTTDSVADSTIRIVRPSDLKLGNGYGTAVISNAQKFVIPVPELKEKGELLIYPKNHRRRGEPIEYPESSGSLGRGIVFYNFKDKTIQAAIGDGKNVIIINEVTQEQAQELNLKITKLHPKVNDLSLKDLKQIISYAHHQLGLSDMYNSTRVFVNQNMISILPNVDPNIKVDSAYGFKMRDNRTVNRAIYIPGKFLFEGPAATPQRFYNGGVIVEQNGKMRGVQPKIFIRTYLLANGKSIKSLNRDIKIKQ